MSSQQPNLDFFCRMNACLRKIYILFVTNIFCIKIYFSNEIHIFYIFIYIFLCKKFFSVKQIFNIKLFFHKKIMYIICINNLQIMYTLLKTKYFFKKKNKFFFNLVLQQINNYNFFLTEGFMQPIQKNYIYLILFAD